MVVVSLIGGMGSGKTLSAMVLVSLFRAFNPQGKIYANLPLKVEGSEYLPHLTLPTRSLNDCLILADDIYALAGIKGLMGVIVNQSRKNNVCVILTYQYYSMLAKSVRDLSFAVFPSLSKSKSILRWKVYLPAASLGVAGLPPDRCLLIRKPIERFGGLYDTTYIVPQRTPATVLAEIRRIAGSDESYLRELIEISFAAKSEKKEACKALGIEYLAVAAEMDEEDDE